MVGVMNAVTQTVQGKFNVLRPLLDERTRRLWAAAEARAIGRGGIARVAEATGMSRGTVRAGVRELDSAPRPEARAGRPRVRAPGGGRKALVDRDPGLVKALERLLDPFTRGDPQGPLRWTCSSAARLAEQLGAEGHRVSERTVNRLLHELGYSLQPTARRSKAVSIRIGMRSSGASPGACGRSNAWGSRWPRSTRRRRS